MSFHCYHFSLERDQRRRMIERGGQRRSLISHEGGFSIIETMLAVAIVGIVVTGFAGAVVFAQENVTQGARRMRATMLSDEGLEAARSIRDNAFNELKYNQSAILLAGGEWTFEGEGTTESIDIYSRTITFASVCRDALGAIASCPAMIVDPHTLKITSLVTWQEPRSGTQTISKETYVTNWESQEWTQTDWQGGGGQTLWSDASKYSADDGNVDVTTAGEAKLAPITSSCSGASWTFDAEGDYTFDPNKIEVVSGVARLKTQSGVIASGQTANPGFDTASSWTYGTWDLGNQETSVTQRSSTGGNPTWWVSTTLTARKNRQVGGYAQQSFVTTVDNPDSVLVTLDYQTWSRSLGPNDRAYFYVFVEPTSGAPTSIANAVWSHQYSAADPLQTWQTGVSIDATSKITAQGTYYVKLAVWLETANATGNPNRSFRGGYDNARLTWTKNGPQYPSDRPPINNGQSYEPPSIDTWTTFSESATKNGGEIYYQISDDDGATWYYWDGTQWAAAGAGDDNTAADVNAHLAEFDAVNGKFMFKAFLESDGTQAIELDEVAVGCDNAQGGTGNFETSGWLESSAFDTSASSKFQIVEWDETIPACTPACAVSVQVRTAPDGGGVPGTWTPWYGATGAGTFFTNASGTRIWTELNDNRWVQYRFTLEGDGTETPVINEIRVNYK